MNFSNVKLIVNDTVNGIPNSEVIENVSLSEFTNQSEEIKYYFDYLGESVFIPCIFPLVAMTLSMRGENFIYCGTGKEITSRPFCYKNKDYEEFEYDGKSYSMYYKNFSTLDLINKVAKKDAIKNRFKSKKKPVLLVEDSLCKIRLSSKTVPWYVHAYLAAVRKNYKVYFVRTMVNNQYGTTEYQKNLYLSDFMCMVYRGDSMTSICESLFSKREMEKHKKHTLSNRSKSVLLGGMSLGGIPKIHSDPVHSDPK